MSPSGSKRPAQLGEVELASLQHLWEVGESDVGATHAAVGRKRGISVNTVGSALERLHRKRLVTRQKVSHAYRYRAALTPEQFAARRLLEASGGARALAEGGLLSAFVDLVAEVDDESLDRLQALIDRKRAAREEP